jgi:hypothetical protein
MHTDDESDDEVMPVETEKDSLADLFKDTPDKPGGGDAVDTLDIFGGPTDRRKSQRPSVFDDLDRYEQVRVSLSIDCLHLG